MRSTYIRSIWIVAALCLAATSSVFAATGRVSAITYLDEQNHRRIFAFTTGDDGRLLLNHFNGTGWNWTDHGLPPGATEIHNPKAITYIDSAGNRRIYVFALTNESKLALRFWNGATWQWVYQGGPNLSMNSISAVTYVDPAGNRRIYLFGISSGFGVSSGRLFTNFWNGSYWQWADNGAPNGTSPAGTEAVTYLDDEGERRIDVFCFGYVNGSYQLFSNSWNGSSWNWVSHGGSHLGGYSSTVTFTDASGVGRVYDFVDRDDSLYTHFWSGSYWSWLNLSRPPLTQGMIVRGVAAIAYTDSSSIRRMQAFMLFDGNLFSRTWNGSVWAAWMSHGLPAGSSAVNNITALTYFDSRAGVQHIHLFTNCAESHLCVRYFNGSSWQWLDNGAP
jgi:hypothetical protein